jgi:DNA-binding IclR family transcriptional regulator
VSKRAYRRRRVQVLGALDTVPCTAYDLAIRTGVPVATVRTVLTRLCRDGLSERVRPRCHDGSWSWRLRNDRYDLAADEDLLEPADLAPFDYSPGD